MMAVLVLSLFALNSFAASLKMDVVQTEEYVQFRLETVKEQTSICALIIDHLKMAPSTKQAPGLIDMDVIADPDGIHLFAFGKRKGFFSFAKGYTLPALKPGDYSIVINRENYGVVHVE